MVDNGGTLSGRRALVTGGSSGIGQGIAVELARRGADVAFVYIGQPGPDDTIAAIEELGRQVFAIEADLTDAAASESAVATAADSLGGLDILVNNAGVTVAAPIEETSESTFDRSFALNIRGYFVMAKHALPHLRQRAAGASIVNISSIQGYGAIAPAAVYGATKGAVNAFTQHLAIELAASGVRVNAVAPGIIETPRYFNDPGYTSEIGGRQVPRGRVGRPSDVAHAVAFLCDDASDFIVGHVLYADGGQTATLGLTGFGQDAS